MENIDIKALARELKNTAAKEEADSMKGTVLSKNVDASPKTTYSKNTKSPTLKAIITLANQRNDLALKNDVHIDADAYDILRQLKGRTRLVIGNLVSVLLEEFILEHKTEIIQLLKQKSNRLMK